MNYYGQGFYRLTGPHDMVKGKQQGNCQRCFPHKGPPKNTDYKERKQKNTKKERTELH